MTVSWSPRRNWVSATARNRIQIKGGQSIKDKTTNYYKKLKFWRYCSKQWCFCLILLRQSMKARGQSRCTRADSGIRYRDDNTLIRLLNLWFCIQLEEDAVYSKQGPLLSPQNMPLEMKWKVVAHHAAEESHRNKNHSQTIKTFLNVILLMIFSVLHFHPIINVELINGSDRKRKDTSPSPRATLFTD